MVVQADNEGWILSKRGRSWVPATVREFPIWKKNTRFAKLNSEQNENP